MIDLHTHILPGIDDGAGTIAESIEMCRVAALDGVRVIVATPHFKPGLFELPTAEEVRGRAGELNGRIEEEGLELKILVGAEVRLSEDIWPYLDADDGGGFLTINSNGRYMLSEFPMGSLPGGWREMLLRCIKQGIIPVLAHPERNRYFRNEPDALKEVVDRGVMVQLTAESLLGYAGDEVRSFSLSMIKDGYAHVISTDAHSLELRGTKLSEAVRAASGVVGRDRALRLVTTVPEAIISGRERP